VTFEFCHTPPAITIT